LTSRNANVLRYSESAAKQAASVAVMIAAIVEHSAGGANTFPKKGLPARAGGPIYLAYVIGMS
jgi:hypothetical protein